MELNYTIIRSKRKTMALEITRDLNVVVRVPDWIDGDEIDRFVDTHKNWLKKHMARMQIKLMNHPEPSPELAVALRKNAQIHIPSRVAYYSEKMMLYPTAVTVTSAKTRFGSCSGKNRLSFSWRLMEYPSEAIDYVVVHELAHIAHKNHGQEFYALIAAYLPDWKQRKQLLKL